MDYPKENVVNYAYFSRLNKSLTIDEGSQCVGGLYTDHPSCNSQDAFHVWDIFESDYQAVKNHLSQYSEDLLDSQEGYRLKSTMYILPRKGNIREKLVFFAGLQVKTFSPQIQNVEYGYARIYKVACK